MRKWLAYGLAGFATVAVLLGLAALAITQLDLRGFVAQRATASLGQNVEIGSLHIVPGLRLTLQATDIHIVNLPGGTRPNMIDLRRASAEIDMVSLLFGPTLVHRLELEGLSVLLERPGGGAPNWRFGRTEARPNRPENRRGLPTLLDVRLRDSEVLQRTSGGNMLQIRLDDIALAAPAAIAPAKLTANGAFQKVPITITGDLESFVVLRDPATPYGVKLRARSGDLEMTFAGTMTMPLDVDGADGTLALHAPSIAPLLAMAGLATDYDVPADITGHLTHLEPVWQLDAAAGQIAQSAFAGSSLRLTEGAHGHPDDVKVDMAFDHLDLARLLPAGSQRDDPALAVEDAPDPTLAVQLTAKRLSHSGREATGLTLAAGVTPGVIELQTLQAQAYGARLHATASARSASRGGTMAAAISAVGADLQLLRRAAGPGHVPVTGHLDLHAIASSTGTTLSAITTAAQGTMVVQMRGGRISHDIIQQISTDMRRLFGAPKGMAALTCLFGQAELRGGTATLAPLTLRTPEATISGAGRYDLKRHLIDLTIGSQAATTSSFALDIPIHISGPIGNPAIAPFSGQITLPHADMSKLPDAMRAAIQGNPCAPR